MASMIQTRRPSKARSKPADVVSLCLAINHQCYNVTPVRGIQDPEIVRCWRLEKAGNPDAVYDVAVHRHGGIACECPDWQTRHFEFNTAGCKHVRALVGLGLIEALGPITRSTAIPGVTRVRDEFDEPAGDDDLPAGIRVVDPARIPADPIPPEQVGPEAPPAAPELAPPPEPAAPAAGGTPPLGPEPSLIPGLPLDELAAARASWYRSWGNDAGDLFAEHFDLLVANLRCCSTPGRPITPDQYRGRIEALEDHHAGR